MVPFLFVITVVVLPHTVRAYWVTLAVLGLFLPGSYRVTRKPLIVRTAAAVAHARIG